VGGSTTRATSREVARCPRKSHMIEHCIVSYMTTFIILLLGQRYASRSFIDGSMLGLLVKVQVLVRKQVSSNALGKAPERRSRHIDTISRSARLLHRSQTVQYPIGSRVVGHIRRASPPDLLECSAPSLFSPSSTVRWPVSPQHTCWPVGVLSAQNAQSMRQRSFTWRFDWMRSLR
jgi:hypothetical protein